MERAVAARNRCYKDTIISNFFEQAPNRGDDRRGGEGDDDGQGSGGAREGRGGGSGRLSGSGGEGESDGGDGDASSQRGIGKLTQSASGGLDDDDGQGDGGGGSGRAGEGMSGGDGDGNGDATNSERDPGGDTVSGRQPRSGKGKGEVKGGRGGNKKGVSREALRLQVNFLKN